MAASSTLGHYGGSLALLTDLYQLTMAYGYWKAGVVAREAVFHLHFRQNPFKGGYAIAAGLQTALDFLERYRFSEEDTGYLATLTGNDGSPLFDRGFLDLLQKQELTVDVDAIPEGTAVFPHEPLLRVQGPLWQCQVLETALLTILNFQTLVATKAARVCEATRGEPVLEFGLRRAQGIDGGLVASRAAYLGGVAATSNVLAGKLFGIPVRGTHAHSWVMSFASEQEAFDAYAQAMPNNCTFLVDTFDTLEGVRRAVATGKRLREAGHELAGVRLDSGDLAYLSIEARRILDEGGFPSAAIVASNDLDETVITSLKDQGATISVWGVGTRLVTAYDQPALGGVYKLGAVRDPGGPWQDRIKISAQAIKTSTPGVHQVRRFRDGARFVADMIWSTTSGPLAGEVVMVDPLDATRRRAFTAEFASEDLLVPVVRGGKRVYEDPPLEVSRARAREQLAMLHPSIRRALNPHEYPVGLERSLFERKTAMVLSARGF